MLRKFLKIFMVLILSISLFKSVSYANSNIEDKDILPAIHIDDFNDITYEESLSFEDMLKDKLNIGLISIDSYNKTLSEYNKNSRYSSRAATSNIRYQKFSFDSEIVNTTELLVLKKKYVLTPVIFASLEFDNSGVPKRIVSIHDPHIYTGNGENCRFVGTIFYKLESYKSIYLGTYGDIFKTADVTLSGGVSVSIGKSAKAEFKATYSNNHVKNVSFDRRKTISTPYK